jgi:hypothetical protein
MGDRVSFEECRAAGRRHEHLRSVLLPDDDDQNG